MEDINFFLSIQPLVLDFSLSNEFEQPWINIEHKNFKLKSGSECMRIPFIKKFNGSDFPFSCDFFASSVRALVIKAQPCFWNFLNFNLELNYFFIYIFRLLNHVFEISWNFILKLNFFNNFILF